MDILELILSRQTVHSYSAEAVPSEVIAKCIQAGIHAPNHKMTWPWRFILAGPKSRKKIADLNIQLKAKKSALSDIEKNAIEKKFTTEGSLLVAFIKKSTDAVTMKEDYAAMACALQNMALYLHSEGYGSKWSTGGIISREEIYKILNMSPEEYECCGLFWLGKAKASTKKIPRPDVAQFFTSID